MAGGSRSARDRMLHSIAGEDLDAAVVQLHRDMNGNLPGGSAEHLSHAIVEPQTGGCFIETRGGRLLLSVGRAVPSREQKPAAGPDYGWNDTFVYYSDDKGATWQQSADVLSLRLEAENVTRHGAIEPVMLEPTAILGFREA